MKVCSTLALFVGLSTAASILTPHSAVAVLEDRKVSRPHEHEGSSTLASASVPENAPADYHTATTTLMTREELTKLSIDGDHSLVQRRDASKKARGPITALDFYECATTVRYVVIP